MKLILSKNQAIYLKNTLYEYMEIWELKQGELKLNRIIKQINKKLKEGKG